MFEIKRKTATVILPSGVVCTIGELQAAQQGILTKKGKNAAKMNELLADLIIDIKFCGNGDKGWAEIAAHERIAAAKQFLSGDRKYILAEGRQLCMDYPTKFTFYHEYKNKAGVKKKDELLVTLITEENQQEVWETIRKQCPSAEAGVIEQLNRVGCFPTRPYKKQFTAYPIDIPEIELIVEDVEIEGYELKFRMLTGQLEEDFTEDSDSNSRLEARKLRARKKKKGNEENGGAWEAVPLQTIKSMPAPLSDKIIAKISEQEGDVDTVEVRETEDGRMVVDLTSELSFFFPSGKV